MLLHGEVTAAVDDFVVRRNDGVAAYHLAVVVDDAASGIDQVVRGDDLLPAAVNQAYLAGLLGSPAPTYAHVPLAVNAEGRRLAKRDGAVTLADLAAQGRDRGGGARPDRRLARPAGRGPGGGLLPHFDPARLPRDAPWVVERPSVGVVIIWADGEVTEVRASWPGAVELTVARRDRPTPRSGRWPTPISGRPPRSATGCCSTSRR